MPPPLALLSIEVIGANHLQVAMLLLASFDSEFFARDISSLTS